MIRKFLTTLVSLITVIIVNCQQYDVSSIPDSLLSNANVIKRFEELVIEIESIDKAVIKHKYAFTILNENGERYAQYANQFDKLRKLRKIDGKLFNDKGFQLKDMKRKDIYEGSANDDAFLSDDRFKAFSFNHNVYPYTVEFEDEVVLEGIYYLYHWDAVNSYNMAVQYSKMAIKQPKNYNVRLKIVGGDFINKSLKEEVQLFELKNFKAKEWEPYAPNPNFLLPNIQLAPSNFSISGYKGNMDTWQGFGKFQLELNQGKSDLPDDIKKAVHTVADGKATIEEKVNAVYKYMQDNTRYISIQLGIGGWQPLPASFVAQKKYGDCKALSNYMVNMLQEVGVNANYVIIKSDSYERNGLDENFPAPFFNHVVCCVPNGKDSIWLECTSQTVSPGYFGRSTGNKKALLVNNDGGFIVQTPKFNVNNDYTKRTVKAKIDETGKINIQLETVYSGTEQGEIHGMFYYANDEQKKRHYNTIYNLPNFTVSNFELKEQKGRVPKMFEKVEIEAENYASISGKRIFVVANLFAREPKFSNDKPREFPIVYSSTYRHIDTINVAVPLGYSIESMPKNVDITNEFGKYKINYSFKDNTIQVIRWYEQEANTFAPNKYEALVAFYDIMYKADRAKVVLVKKEE